MGRLWALGSGLGGLAGSGGGGGASSCDSILSAFTMLPTARKPLPQHMLRAQSCDADTGLAHVARLPMLRRLHLAFCVRLTDAGLCLLARVAPASAAFAVGRAGCGHAGSGACAVGNFGGTSVGEEPPAWPVSGCGAPGGAPDLDGHGRVAGGDEHTSSGGGVGVCGGTGARRPPPLEEVELYQVHQVSLPLALQID